MIHLDTSFLIRALLPRSREDARLRRWLRDREGLGMSAIAWCEFLCGPVGDSGVALAERVVGEIVPFSPRDAVTAARLFNEAGRKRGSLVDCMIAATALRGDARIATANAEDFRRLRSAGGPAIA